MQKFVGQQTNNGWFRAVSLLVSEHVEHQLDRHPQGVQYYNNQ